jgi:serine/threonine protein phosphatase PrpC
VTEFNAIQYASVSDVGVRRSHNQDAFAVLPAAEDGAWQERGHLFLVADGMGAHAVGELASKLAVDLIPHTYQKHAGNGATEALRRAFSEANSSIHNRGQQNPEFEGMGTTSTALVVRADGAWVGHVGDSRVYRLRSGKMEQLSFDHSLQWELARRQRVRPDEIEGIPSNVIVRSLGPEPQVEVDIEGPHPIWPGDLYLVCSDGLSGQISDHEMGAVISVLPPDEACRFLVDLANLRGGPDNITAILVRIPGESPPSSYEFKLEEPSKRHWIESVPWSGIAFVTGVGLAMAALGMVIAGWAAIFYMVPFCLSVASLGAGFLAMLRSHRRDSRAERQQVTDDRPRIYRQTACRIDQHLVQSLTHADQLLRERARDRGWDVDWSAHQQHDDAARAYQEKEEWFLSFRERCRSMAQLTAALRRQRNKEEVFQPVWEREPD